MKILPCNLFTSMVSSGQSSHLPPPALRFPHFPQKPDVAHKQFLQPPIPVSYLPFHLFLLSSWFPFLNFYFLLQNLLMSPRSFRLPISNNFTLSLYLISHFFYVSYLGLSHKHSWNAFVTISSSTQPSCCIHNILTLLTSLYPVRSQFFKVISLKEPSLWLLSLLNERISLFFSHQTVIFSHIIYYSF